MKAMIAALAVCGLGGLSLAACGGGSGGTLVPQTGGAATCPAEGCPCGGPGEPDCPEEQTDEDPRQRREDVCTVNPNHFECREANENGEESRMHGTFDVAVSEFNSPSLNSYERYDAWGLSVGDAAAIWFVERPDAIPPRGLHEYWGMHDITAEATGQVQYSPPSGSGMAYWRGNVIGISTVGVSPWAGAPASVDPYDKFDADDPLMPVRGDFALSVDLSEWDYGGEFRGEITNLSNGYSDFAVDFERLPLPTDEGLYFRGYGKDEESTWHMLGGFRGSGHEAFLGTFQRDFRGPDSGDIVKGLFAGGRTGGE